MPRMPRICLVEQMQIISTQHRFWFLGPFIHYGDNSSQVEMIDI